jgi:hypothetical protein
MAETNFSGNLIGIRINPDKNSGESSSSIRSATKAVTIPAINNIAMFRTPVSLTCPPGVIIGAQAWMLVLAVGVYLITQASPGRTTLYRHRSIIDHNQRFEFSASSLERSDTDHSARRGCW